MGVPLALTPAGEGGGKEERREPHPLVPLDSVLRRASVREEGERKREKERGCGRKKEEGVKKVELVSCCASADF